jgi:hypothetical protein
MNNKPEKRRKTPPDDKTLAFKVGTIAVGLLTVIVILYVLRFTFGVHL